ncbi:hypothetical protein N7519_001460 [Penicillium mononematosum]|uniref:uncharacterized protein n=1 Tax=Penicillium mononematosum TaxID=268346 RepID=UPI00254822BD|nr:uncharacterized protein N7519_001460 [Penicillium mononematosum]KAJ6191439.1 hypothetical protein N7519_001460 [Penicillium mononematosum]
MPDQQLISSGGGRHHVRSQLSVSISQFLFCLTCVQLNITEWMRAGGKACPRLISSILSLGGSPRYTAG